ncbi:DUF3224 domain-containing protein [Roseiterribacter gracilis]|uniref:DUF3224 domain-containing protein n=1 Tax=Roseiterribacter gracilis TaxID=2812848 RepID=A0A8S8XEW1_9PROT|nr:hypothetical protein TMPK1_27080 [Rhodospirillales bacterium TMPK1]
MQLIRILVVSALCLGAIAQQAAAKTMQQATGTFEVKVAPLTAEDTQDGITLGRYSIDKQFSGDLVASSKGEMLAVGTTVKGSAGYGAAERVTGALKGKKGSFGLVHRGLMGGGKQEMQVVIVPDSGSDELKGIEGTLTIKIADGKHHYALDYTLP